MPLPPAGQHLAHRILGARVVEPGHQHEGTVADVSIGVIGHGLHERGDRLCGSCPADRPRRIGSRLVIEVAKLVDRREFAGYWEYLLEDALFTTPAFPQFGGAALIDAAGELVGVGSLTVPDAAGSGIPSPGNMFLPIDALKPDDLGVDVTPRLKTLKIEEPRKRQGGERLGSVAELVDKLKNEARVI